MEDPCRLNGEYWKQLVNINVPLSFSDIGCFTTHSLVILFSVLSCIAILECKWKKIIIFLIINGCLITTTVLFLTIFSCTILIQDWVSNRLPFGLSDISQEVRSQLKDSLLSYGDGEDDIINNAWENTMKVGCCCGVDGYTDFLDIRTEIPEYCICPSNITSNSSSPGFCDPQLECDPKNNQTTKGCHEFIMNKIQIYQIDIYVKKILVSSTVSSLQFIFFILTMDHVYNYLKKRSVCLDEILKNEVTTSKIICLLRIDDVDNTNNIDKV